MQEIRSLVILVVLDFCREGQGERNSKTFGEKY